MTLKNVLIARLVADTRVGDPSLLGGLNAGLRPDSFTSTRGDVPLKDRTGRIVGLATYRVDQEAAEVRADLRLDLERNPQGFDLARLLPALGSVGSVDRTIKGPIVRFGVITEVRLVFERDLQGGANVTQVPTLLEHLVATCPLAKAFAAAFKANIARFATSNSDAQAEWFTKMVKGEIDGDQMAATFLRDLYTLSAGRPWSAIQ